MRRGHARLLLLGALILAGATRAAHITDKLAVGLHDAPEDETPRRVLTSGTPLEILDRRGRFCNVRLGDGDGGWLECRYVTDEKPARAMLVETQARAGQLWDQLEELKRQLEEKQDRQRELELRLRAAERLVEEQDADPGEQETGTVPDTATTEETEQPGRDAPAECDFGWWLPALLGAAGGCVLGALLLFWRCRRRYGGLRI